MKKVYIVLLMAILAMNLSGCILWNEVPEDHVGCVLFKRQVEYCLNRPGGVIYDGRYRSDLREISVSTMTFEVSDPEVATYDNQLVGVTITIQARRKMDEASLTEFLTRWSRLLNDEQFVQTIDATAREGIKNGTRQFTLTELLNDRNKLAAAITTHLETDAGKYYAEIVNVTIENIDIDDEYAATLTKTAQLTSEKDYQLRRQEIVRQTAETDQFDQEQRRLVEEKRLLAEKAKSAVEIEIARREGEKTKVAQEIYLTKDRKSVV